MKVCCNCQSSHDHYCIDNVPIFVDLPFEIKESIMAASSHKKYGKGEIIFSPGDYFDYLFVVNKGRVKISKISAMGKEQILRILEPGEFMGELSLFNNTLLTNSAEAMEDTEICIIKSQRIRELIMEKPEIALKFLQKYAERIEQSEELIEQIGLMDVEQRIASYLISMVEKKNIKSRNNEYEINLSVSKGVLASMIGTTQETLSRKLSLLQDNGLIKLIGHRKIIITDMDGLENIL
ncbi:MAG TPA: Crp/Fnr family transcriptional regulator [Tissierellia bacterium]|jgi:CRP-like cAMP-binding protein|nr:Crp/Fnr family transcriptional regulator [Tissierellia bacterium]